MKSDFERGQFGAWAFHTRDRLDLKVEQVAADQGYHPASLRKMESGNVDPSRRMLRDLPEYYARIAAEKGIRIEPAPVAPREESPNSDLASAVRLLADAVTRQNQLLQRLLEGRTGSPPSQEIDPLLAGIVAREQDDALSGPARAGLPKASADVPATQGRRRR